MEKIGRYSQELLNELSDKIDNAFNASELRNLCFTLYVDSDNFPQNKKEFVNELIRYFARRNQLQTLIDQCRKERPGITWPAPPTRKAKSNPAKGDKLVSSALETKVAELAYQYLAQRYGIGYDMLQVQWTIANDGSAEVRRIVNVEAYSPTQTLDTFLLVPERSPQGQERTITIDAARVDSLTPGKQVKLVRKIGERGKLSTLIEIIPTLLNQDSVKYQMVENLDKGLYAIGLSEKEIRERETLYDYVGWTINRPTRHLSMEVYFPSQFAPNTYSLAVRYASASGLPSHQQNYREEELLKRPTMTILGGKHHLKLEVDYPPTGLIYLIRWDLL